MNAGQNKHHAKGDTMYYARLFDQMLDPIDIQAFASGETEEDVLDILKNWLQEDYEDSEIDFVVGTDGNTYVSLDGSTRINGSWIRVGFCSIEESTLLGNCAVGRG